MKTASLAVSQKSKSSTTRHKNNRAKVEDEILPSAICEPDDILGSHDDFFMPWFKSAINTAEWKSQ